MPRIIQKINGRHINYCYCLDTCIDFSLNSIDDLKRFRGEKGVDNVIIKNYL